MRIPRGLRRAFSLVEVITALTILAVIGVALTKLMLSQTRSFQYENASRRARTASRSAMNILATDLRMAQDIGALDSVDTVNNRWIDLKVPVAFGIVCEVNAGSVVLGLVPVDSFQIASSKYGGYAVRNKANATATYTYTSSGSGDTIQTVASTRCSNAGIYSDTASIGGRTGRVVSVTPGPAAGVVPAVGDPAFVWQHVRYQFGDSKIYPNRTGLWRRIRGRADTDSLREELIAPFQSRARFSYYTNPPAFRDTALRTAPGNLNLVRGFQIYLPAESSDTVSGRTAPQRANTTMSVFFKNTRVQ